VALMVPTAIFSNSVRIVGTGIAAHYLGIDAATSFLHNFSSWIVFMVALLIIFACHMALRGLNRFVSRYA
jgi:exosortase/archaeosortase family protein